MDHKRAGKAFLLALLAVLFWSTSPTAFKLGLRHQDSWQLLTGAALSSTLILGLLILVRGTYKKIRNFTWKDLAFSALMGLLNPVAYYLILFKAYSLLPAQVAQPLNMIWPLVLVLLSVPVLGQGMGWKELSALLISFSGVILISFQGGTIGEEKGNILGIVLALSTSILWAIYFLFNARDSRDPLIRMFLNFVFASATLLTIGLFKGQAFPPTNRAWLAATYVGFFEMGITFVLWLVAVQTAPSTSRISNLVYLAPFLNLFLARFILDEGIYPSTIFGIILLVGGILLQNYKARPMKHE